MSLIRKQKRITAKEVADLLGCAPNTVYNKGAGTEQLTRIKNGTRQVRFLLDEVMALVNRQEGSTPKLVIPKQSGQQHSISL